MTELRIEPYVIPAAEMGQENPLPRFRNAESQELTSIDQVPEEDSKYFGWMTSFRVLPFRMQDGYTRERQPRAFVAGVLENEYLRATVLPELGGKLVSLFHKPSGVDLISPMKWFQPANVALRNAWTSGGIEWNAGQFGHSYLTCSPIFAARVRGAQGEPVLRLYAWERAKCFPYQIDFQLPDGSEFLFARVRIINPHDHEIPMYWWTNMAVTQKPGRRTLVPADSAIHPSENGFSLSDLPIMNGFDSTYATNSQQSCEWFYRIDKWQRPWISVIDEDGSGFVHTSTARLKGRKMFIFGTNQGGNHWNEFLQGPSEPYLEIQAGLTQIQNESIPMPANSEWSWTEAFGPIIADPAAVHGEDWTAARMHVDRQLETTLPRAMVDEMDRKLAASASVPPEDLFVHGHGWGALERCRLHSMGETDRIPGEFVFDGSDMCADQQPWLVLLESGALPESDPREIPGHYMIQPQWRQLLEDSIRDGRGDHWLSWLHLGIMRMEEFDTAGARAAWETSIERRPSAWAYRNLAVLELKEENKEQAAEFYELAWKIGPEDSAIAVEYCQLLLQMNRGERLEEFVAGLPDNVQSHERIRIVMAGLALEHGDLDETRRLSDYEFATIQEGETILTDLWFGLHERQLALEENIEIDDELRRRVRRDFPPPAKIDFRMVSDQGL